MAGLAKWADYAYLLLGDAVICRSISFVIRGYMSLGHTQLTGNA